MLSLDKNFSIFKYNENDFNYHVTEDLLSSFDSKIKDLWEQAEKKGIFRYILKLDKWKILNGKYGFLLQLNINRNALRRKPQSIQSMVQPFNPDDFNFTKISEQEILFDIQNGDGNNVIAFNVSPIEYGHCIILVDRLQCLSQNMTEKSLQIAIEILLLSKSQYARCIFNSLCAHASVNHLHWHIYYLKYEMPLEYIEVEKFEGPLYLLTSYPSQGFCLKLSTFNKLQTFISWGFAIINCLQEHQIAHNVYITRAKNKKGENNYNDVRMYIWARKSYQGVKDDDVIIAVCELFGHFSIKNEQIYESLTEEKLATALNDITAQSFKKAKEVLRSIIQNKLLEISI